MNSSFTTRLLGLAEDASREVLATVYAQRQNPDVAEDFHRRVGAIASWDHRAPRHYAKDDYCGHRREMNRITNTGVALA